MLNVCALKCQKLQTPLWSKERSILIWNVHYRSCLFIKRFRPHNQFEHCSKLSLKDYILIIVLNFWSHTLFFLVLEAVTIALLLTVNIFFAWVISNSCAIHFGNNSRWWTIEKCKFFFASWVIKNNALLVKNLSRKILYLCFLIPQSEYIKICHWETIFRFRYFVRSL